MKKIYQILLLILGLGFVGGSFYFLKQPLGQVVAFGFGLILAIFPLVVKNPNFGLALMGFFLPVERVPSFDIGGFTVKINHLIIIITLLAYIVSIAVRKELKIPKDPIRFYLTIFIMLLLFSVPGALNLSRAIQVFVFIVLMFVIYLLVTFIANDKEKLKAVLKGVFWGGFVSGVIGLYQFAGDAAGLPIAATLLKEGYDKITFGFARIQSTAAEPLYFANYIFIPLMMTLVLTLRGKVEELVGKKWAIALIVILLVDFVLAVSRGAYLGAAVVLVFLLITQAKKILTLKNILATVLVGVLVVAGSWLALVKLGEPRAIDEFIGHVMVNDATKGESVVSRLSASEQALALYDSSKLLGVGLGSFGPAVERDSDNRPETGWKIVNNEYLELLAENGIVGLLGFCLVLFAVFYRGIRAYYAAQDEFLKALISGLLLAFVGILIQYATFSTLAIIHIWFLIGLISTTTIIIFAQNEKKRTN